MIAAASLSASISFWKTAARYSLSRFVETKVIDSVESFVANNRGGSRE